MNLADGHPLACPVCGSIEWEMEADTQESATYHVDFSRHVFAENEDVRDMQSLTPTDWFCLGCNFAADKALKQKLDEEFVDEERQGVAVDPD